MTNSHRKYCAISHYIFLFETSVALLTNEFVLNTKLELKYVFLSKN